MASLPSGEFSSSITNSIPRTQPHQTSERAMLQTPGRIRTQRASVDGLPGTGEDRPIRTELVRQIKAQIMNAYGEKAFKGNIEMSSAIFPDKRVRKGDKWTITTNLESGMSAVMTSEYTLADVTPTYSLIKGESVIETANKESYTKANGRPVRYNLKGSMISEIKVDPASGWTMEAKIDQDIRGDVYMKENEEAIENNGWFGMVR